MGDPTDYIAAFDHGRDDERRHIAARLRRKARARARLADLRSNLANLPAWWDPALAIKHGGAADALEKMADELEGA